MSEKKDAGFWVGMGLIGVGVAIGAYAAKKYIDRRKKLLKNYDIEVDRLQNEVDFDYSEDFLKELKKETLQADKKHYSKDDLKKVVKENTDAIKAHVSKLESTLKEYIKKSEKESDEDGTNDGESAGDGVQIIIEEFNTEPLYAEDEDFEPEEQ